MIKTRQIHLTKAFFIALAMLLLSSALFTNLSLAYFVPVIIITIYRYELVICLWLAMSCGLILDLLSSTWFFGMHSCTYVLTTALLYSSKKNLFEDSIITLPLFTAIYSSLATLILWFLVSFLDKSIPLSSIWILKDLLLMPLLDSIYAFICFTIPLVLLRSRRRQTRQLKFKRPQ